MKLYRKELGIKSLCVHSLCLKVFLPKKEDPAQQQIPTFTVAHSANAAGQFITALETLKGSLPKRDPSQQQIPSFSISAAATIAANLRLPGYSATSHIFSNNTSCRLITSLGTLNVFLTNRAPVLQITHLAI